MAGIGGAGRKAAYAEYLKSDHWKNLKKQKALIEPKICAACSSEKKVQLHHMLYRELFEETQLEDTCWLCSGCHKTFHLRAGVTIKKQRSVEWIREETIRIILADVPKRQSQKLTRRERRRITTEMRRQAKLERKCKAERSRLKREEDIRTGKRKPKWAKPPRPEWQVQQGKFNAAVHNCKPGSPLKSTMAGQVVAVNPKR